ncbi:MAG: SRPBCC domain-containing protein [Desulfurellaceae bacterium]|nr:SRPBCC domain-containing protein [Desulfurellaceae bacterium]
MTLLHAKWFLSLLLLTVGGCHSVYTELTIPAGPEEIWPILTDAPGYQEWNPVFVHVEGEYREGGTLQYQMKSPDSEQMAVQATVKKLVPNKELNQYGGFPGVLTFSHTYLLEPVDGGTRVIQKEEYRGIWVPFWDSSWVEPAYNKVNEALQDRVAQLKENGRP